MVPVHKAVVLPCRDVACSVWVVASTFFSAVYCISHLQWEFILTSLLPVKCSQRDIMVPILPQHAYLLTLPLSTALMPRH